MRDNHWLAKQLDFLLKTYFSNVEITNPIEIRFGREAKFRFGSIRLVKPKGLKSPRRQTRFVGSFPNRVWNRLANRDSPQKSIITITSVFASESVPVGVVHYTIAHELCHFAHGFSSANKRLFKFPHHGGVVNRELTERGAHELIGAFKKWLKDYRKKILAGREGI